MPRDSFRSLRWITFLSSLGVLVPWYVLVLHDFSSWREDWDSLLIPILGPIWLPHLLLFFDLRRKSDGVREKRTLANCAAWGVFLLGLSARALVAAPRSAFLFVWPATIALAQCVLVVLSLREYHLIDLSDGGSKVLGWRIAVSVVALFVCALAIAPMCWQRSPAFEASSVGSLRTIYSAQATYAQEHPEIGYASSLSQLGPQRGANLIDGVLAAGEKAGYRFDLQPHLDQSGKVIGYLAIARPKNRGKDGVRSFTTSETGKIYYTAEDRPATLQDPKIE